MKPDEVKVQFLGSGDNFGGGGQLQTCIFIKSLTYSFLLDCGTTMLIALKRAEINTKDIETILITHLHGDHFGGLPFLILNEQFSKRDNPLIIVGPQGITKRLFEAMEVLYPGSSKNKQKYPLIIDELEPEIPKNLKNIRVTGYPAIHFSGAPSLMLRVEFQNRIIVYTGDTEWTDEIVRAANNADLFISEAYFYEKKIRYHMDYSTLLNHRKEIEAKRIVLTHLGEDMYLHLNEIELEYAQDGKELFL